MSIGGLKPFYPSSSTATVNSNRDSVTANSSNASRPFYKTMGKSLLDVKSLSDPFEDFLLSSSAVSTCGHGGTALGGGTLLPSSVTEETVMGAHRSMDSTLAEGDNEGEVASGTITTLLPPSDSFMLSGSPTAPALILNDVVDSLDSSNSANACVPFGELYTLTLGDGTAVQLRVQTCDEQQNAVSSELSTAVIDVQPLTIPPPASPQPVTTIPPTEEPSSMDWSGSLPELDAFPDAFTNLLSREELLITKSSGISGFPPNNYPSTESSSSLASDEDAECLKHGKMDLEALRNDLNTLPDGQLNLEAILRNADVELSVEEIVRPTLTSLKKLMVQRNFTDWQSGLCLKIRRRKKNTAAVRSSRRKRVQYMYDLKDHVGQLTKRRKEAELENSLLKQLKFLWERLVQEVEAEVVLGTKNKNGVASTPHGRSQQET